MRCPNLGYTKYEGHSLCFAIWVFNNTYNHSVHSSFSKKPPSACTHLTILSNQLSMTPAHADWGMSKMTPSMNAQASSAFWNCFSFSCLLTEGNKNQSQGAKSCEQGGWVARWTSLVTRKSRVTAVVSALALSWWSSRPRTPVRGRHLHHAWKILGKQWLTYQSAVIVFLSSSGMVATWPKFAKTHAIICLEALLFLLSFTGRFSSGKTHTADCCFVSGSYWYTQVASPVTMSQTLGDLPPSIFLSMWVHHSTLPRFCSSLKLWSTQRAQRFLTPRQSWWMRVRLPDEIYDILYFSVCHFWVLLNQGLYPRDVFWGNGRCHSTTTVIVFQRSRSRHE